MVPDPHRSGPEADAPAGPGASVRVPVERIVRVVWWVIAASIVATPALIKSASENCRCNSASNDPLSLGRQKNDGSHGMLCQGGGNLKAVPTFARAS